MTIVLINLVYLDPPRNGGVSRIAHEVAHLLCDMEGVTTVFAVGAGFVSEFPTWLGRSARLIPYLTGQTPSPLIKALHPDFIISPLFGIEPFEGDEFRDAVHVAGVPDALALDKPELFLPHEQQIRALTYERVRGAKVIVTLSHHARQRLIERLKLSSEQVHVVGRGADLEAQQLTGAEGAERADVPQPYVFYPANNWPHKRHELLFKVMAEVWKSRPELNLVLTGGRSGAIALEPMIAAAPKGRVHDLGFVDEAQLKSLYTHAEALLFLSEHEGFGMPVVEAMLHECPVICAPVTSLPEVAGEAALYVHSEEPRAWAKVLLTELPQQRAVLVEAGKVQAAQFTWAKTRAGWAAALSDAGLKPSGASQVPAISLDAVIEEVNMWRKQSPAPNSDARQAMERVENAMQQVEAVRLSENQSRWAAQPGIGFVVRTLTRLRNLGKMWEARARLDWAMINYLKMVVKWFPDSDGGKDDYPGG